MSYDSYCDHLHKTIFDRPNNSYYQQGCLARLLGFPKADNPYGKYQDRFFTHYSQEKCKQDWNRGWDDQDNVLYGDQSCNS